MAGYVLRRPTALHWPAQSLIEKLEPSVLYAPSMAGGRAVRSWICKRLGQLVQTCNNYNALIGNELCDPISGSVPLRSYPCQIFSADNPGWITATTTARRRYSSLSSSKHIAEPLLSVGLRNLVVSDWEQLHDAPEVSALGQKLPS